jgi:hypothetical protein
MADFPLHFRVNDYRTEQGQVVRAKRGYLFCELAGGPIVCDAFLDTAAPFGVVPYTFSRQVSWQRLATTLTHSGAAVPSVLLWQGIPCELGKLTLSCIQAGTGLRSGPLSLLAKFPRQSTRSPLERTLVLGLSWLDENDVRLVLGSVGGVLSGYLAVA